MCVCVCADVWACSSLSMPALFSLDNTDSVLQHLQLRNTTDLWLRSYPTPHGGHISLLFFYRMNSGNCRKNAQVISFCVDKPHKLQGRLTDGLCSICMTIMLISYADRSTGVLQESVSICFSVRHQLPLICLKSTLLCQSWALRLRCTYPLIHSQNDGVTLSPGAVCPCT